MATVPSFDDIIRHHGPGASGRGELEAFTARHYRKHYAARLREFYPHLLAVDHAGGLRACIGFRGAHEGGLFLEQYFDEPIEDLLGGRLGLRLGRRQIVEVGGLAADWPGAARRLMLLSAAWLYARGFRAVAFTATRCVANSFRRLGLMPVDFGAADPRRLHTSISDWGSYYEHGPRVFAGPLAAALPLAGGSELDAGAGAC